MACNTNRYKVLITYPGVPQEAITLLNKYCDVIINDEQPQPTRQEILDKIKGVHGILFASILTLDKEMIEAAGPQLKMVAVISSGYENVDVQELKSTGVLVSNVPAVYADSVADTAVMLTLAASRRFQEARKCLEDGSTSMGPTWMLGQDIHDSVVGIVGLGAIGTAIAKRLKVFNVAEILYSGHREKPEGKVLGASFVPHEELIARSDFVIVSAPLTEETEELFDEAAFKKMKKNAVFVNVARGEIVKQDDLCKALKDGDIFAAGLDVMTPEPLPKNHVLISLPNCVLSPHQGSATINVRKVMALHAVDNLLRGLRGEELLTPI